MTAAIPAPDDDLEEWELTEFERENGKQGIAAARAALTHPEEAE